MYAYMVGIVKEIESNYIVLENSDIGYLIYTASPYTFKIDEKIKIKSPIIEPGEGQENIFISKR